MSFMEGEYIYIYIERERERDGVVVDKFKNKFCEKKSIKYIYIYI